MERSEPLPCVVKILNGGSSVGVFICHTREELHHALRESCRFAAQVLVEQFIEGRDFFCGVLEGESLPPSRSSPRPASMTIRTSMWPAHRWRSAPLRWTVGRRRRCAQRPAASMSCWA